MRKLREECICVIIFPFRAKLDFDKPVGNALKSIFSQAVDQRWMAFPDNQLDDDIVKFLNDNVIINDVEWDGKVLEINESDLSQIHSECSRNRG